MIVNIGSDNYFPNQHSWPMQQEYKMKGQMGMTFLVVGLVLAAFTFYWQISSDQGFVWRSYQTDRTTTNKVSQMIWSVQVQYNFLEIVPRTPYEDHTSLDNMVACPRDDTSLGTQLGNLSILQLDRSDIHWSERLWVWPGELQMYHHIKQVKRARSKDWTNLTNN